MKIIQMPPHINNNSLEISVKQLKSTNNTIADSQTLSFFQSSSSSAATTTTPTLTSNLEITDLIIDQTPLLNFNILVNEIEDLIKS